MKRMAIRIAIVIVTLGLVRISDAQNPTPAQVSQHTEPIPALIEAVWNRDIERVKQLLDAGADPDIGSVTVDGIPPWYWAIFTREDRAAGLMLENVKDANRPLPQGVLPRTYGLLMAANGNQLVIARALLDRGTPVDARARDNATALLIAASSGYADMLKVLIERGAAVNLQDDHGDTALMAAVRVGSLPSVNVLLKAGADVNQKDKIGRTPLQWAARSGRLDMLDALLAAGANQNTADEAGRTALTLAAIHRQAAVVTRLRSRNAKGDLTALSQPLPSPRIAVDRGLKLIQRAAADWTSRAGCVSCHHAPMMFRTIAVAQRRGFTVDEPIVEAQIRFVREQRSKSARALRSLKTGQEISAFSFRNGEGDMGFFGWILSSFLDSGVVRDEDLQAIAVFLANLQLPDGSWRYGPPRVPLLSSDIASTASAIRALRHYAPSGDAEISSRIVRATAWLRSSTPVTIDDKAYRLFGLHWTGSEPASIRKAADLLLEEQNPDGGWPQLRGLNSDAYATGMVLVALHEVVGLQASDAPYRRGVQYLLKMQESDGSWLVHKRAVPMNKYFESGSPHGKFQFISYAGTCWATMALAYASPSQ